MPGCDWPRLAGTAIYRAPPLFVPACYRHSLLVSALLSSLFKPCYTCWAVVFRKVFVAGKIRTARPPAPGFFLPGLAQPQLCWIRPCLAATWRYLFSPFSTKKYMSLNVYSSTLWIDLFGVFHYVCSQRP